GALRLVRYVAALDALCQVHFWRSVSSARHGSSQPGELRGCPILDHHTDRLTSPVMRTLGGS
ncbi:MAG: hypothetical protein JZU67_06115, partial [Burkholderiaceae bacterium]|nr:hypothetical protein [Burkholderiaceae bacterium]